MQVKDFQMLVEVLTEYKNSGFTSGVAIRKSLEKLNSILIPRLKKDNPNFKEERFLEAINKSIL